MIEVIAGTDRPGSYTLQVAKYVQGVFKELHNEVNLLDIGQLKMRDVETVITTRAHKAATRRLSSAFTTPTA